MEFEPIVKRYLGEQAEVAACSQVAQDASSRRYYRLELRSDRGPKSVIVMALPEDPMAADEVSGGEKPEELPFINVARYLDKARLPVPEIYFDATLEGVVLLEDLGDCVFETRVKNSASPEMEQWYGAAIDLLCRMHNLMWPIPDGCVAKARSFDFKLLRWELDHYREWGAEGLNDRVLKEPLRQKLDKVFDELAKEIVELPKGFVHRDYQSRNLMVKGESPTNENLAIIDFQDALIGPRIYDLVALLCDSYIDIPHELQDALVVRYAKARNLDPQTVRNEFDLVTVHRKLKDGARFVFIDRVKNNPSFLPFVEPSFKSVKRALKRLAGHYELKEALREADPKRF